MTQPLNLDLLNSGLEEIACPRVSSKIAQGNNSEMLTASSHLAGPSQAVPSSSSSSCSSSSSSTARACKTSATNKFDLARVSKVKRVRSCRHSWQPYAFPWRPKLEESYRFFSLQEPLPSTALSRDSSMEVKLRSTESAPPTCNVSRQDSGNKSNPSSPVKSHPSTFRHQHSQGGGRAGAEGSEEADGSVCSIIRSRSLGHLDFALRSCDRLSDRVLDMETVSQRISNLHVA